METITYGLGEKYRHTVGFEVLQSYAIISEKMNQQNLESWLSQNSAYLDKFGIMNVYGMFIAGIETAWLADELANKNAKEFNVNWKRAKATTILGGINLEDTYLHVLNADMGMSVTGNSKNIALFRLMNSVNLPNIEEYVLKPVAERFADNTTNSLNNVFSSASNFSIAQLGELIYVFDNNDSAIVLNTTSGVCSVILNHNNTVYKGSQVSTACDCCSVGTTPADIIKGAQDTIKLIKPGINKLQEYLKKFIR